jgi:succinyl-CoA synthetase beta subunit
MEILNFEETKNLLLKYKIPFCKTEIFNSKAKASEFAKKIGFPVVIKVHAPNIFHKSEVGGVKVGIKNLEEFYVAWDEMKKRTRLEKIEGILVQETVFGSELTIGMKRDSQFGPVLMFGLGGIFIEVLKDVAFRVAPFDKKQALEMILEIKGHKLLQGYRGREIVNLNKLAEIIVNLSKLSMAEKKIMSIDLNPVMANKKSILVADFRLIV